MYRFNVNDGLKSAILNLIELEFFMAYTSLKPHILLYSNGPAIWHGLPDIRHIKGNNGLESAILNLIELKFFRAYPSLKPHILFYGNCLAIWHGLPDMSHITANYGR